MPRNRLTTPHNAPSCNRLIVICTATATVTIGINATIGARYSRTSSTITSTTVQNSVAAALSSLARNMSRPTVASPLVATLSRCWIMSGCSPDCCHTGRSADQIVPAGWPTSLLINRSIASIVSRFSRFRNSVVNSTITNDARPSRLSSNLPILRSRNVRTSWINERPADDTTGSSSASVAKPPSDSASSSNAPARTSSMNRRS